MISDAHAAQGLDEMTLGDSGWPPVQYQCPKSSSKIDCHFSNFLAADAICLDSFFPFEALPFQDFITHDTSQPFQCTDKNTPLHFEPQYYGSSRDYGHTTLVASPALEEFNGIGSALDDKHPILNSRIMPNPLQNAFDSVQGRDDIAEIGATICSLIADHLKRLSGLSTTTATTTLLPAANDPLLAHNIHKSSRVPVDSRSHCASHRSNKAQRVVRSGNKHSKDMKMR